MENFGKYSKGLVSIIIPAVVKDKQLPLCIDAVCASTYKKIQIVLVCEGKERSEQRNIGIDRAKGEFLLFLDSDQIISPLLIQECVGALNNFYDSVYIPEEIVTPGWFGRLRNWEREFYTGTLVDCVRFVRAIDCPRFDENMHGPEDADFDRRLKGKRYISHSKLYHYDNIGFTDYCKKKAYYSKSMKKFFNANPNDKVLDFRYRCFGIFLENGKWKKLLRHPLRTVLLMFLVLTRGVIYLVNR
jgi:glycosyltransferase involved in cell wall biosynthesis